MALNTFGLLFSDTFYTNTGTNPDWTVPSDGSFLVPSMCPGKFDYKPATTSMLYHDYTELWLGYPTWTATWQLLEDVDVEAIRQAYTSAISSGTSYGRCWVYWLNGETGAWQADGAIMDEPKQAGYTGELAKDFSLTFGRLGLQMNSHHFYATGSTSAFDRIEAGDTLEYGSSDYANNTYRY